MPSTWSVWWWVMNRSVSFQPRRCEGVLDGLGVRARRSRRCVPLCDIVDEVAEIVGTAEKTSMRRGTWRSLRVGRAARVTGGARSVTETRERFSDNAMTSHVERLIGFYKSPLGKISRALLRRGGPALCRQRARASGSWGLGFATPYMRFTLETGRTGDRRHAGAPGCLGLAARGPVAHRALRSAGTAAHRCWRST